MAEEEAELAEAGGEGVARGHGEVGVCQEALGRAVEGRSCSIICAASDAMYAICCICNPGYACYNSTRWPGAISDGRRISGP